MTRRFSLAAITSVALMAPVVLWAQNSDQTPSPSVMQAVNAAFLQSITPHSASNSGQSSEDEQYSSCGAVLSRRSDGTPELVASGYSDSNEEVAMLAYKTGEARIVDAVDDRQLGFDGGPCDASIVNLADPAKTDSLLTRAVEISFGGQDWYFLWDGIKLRSITALLPGSGVPQSHLAQDSYMHTTGVVDVDHSGAMQIVGNNGDWDKFPDNDGIASTGTDILFRYNGITYAPAETLLFLRKYEPQPSNWSDKMNGPWANANVGEIDMHHTPAPTNQLKIINGDRDGSNRVTSAKVEINGVTVVLPTDVNPGVETFTQTIQLQKQNEIKVTVQGPPKSHIYVTIQ